MVAHSLRRLDGVRFTLVVATLFLVVLGAFGGASRADELQQSLVRVAALAAIAAALWPAAPQRPAFEAARAAGLHLTCHAGEAGEPSSVEEALGLGVERIAHGVIGAREPRIVERIRSEGVVLDLCPTANWKCKAVPSLVEHPLPRLVRAGIRCTISTDSRTVADTMLSREFELASAMGMTDDELQRCNAVAYEARFG